LATDKNEEEVNDRGVISCPSCGRTAYQLCGGYMVDYYEYDFHDAGNDIYHRILMYRYDHAKYCTYCMWKDGGIHNHNKNCGVPGCNSGYAYLCPY